MVLEIRIIKLKCCYAINLTTNLEKYTEIESDILPIFYILGKSFEIKLEYDLWVYIYVKNLKAAQKWRAYSCKGVGRKHWTNKS